MCNILGEKKNAIKYFNKDIEIKLTKETLSKYANLILNDFFEYDYI